MQREMQHKMVEIRMILADLGMEILSQKEAGIQADVVEDGSTFDENAMIKATEIAKIVRQMPEYADAIVMADDSGLEIDYLNKEPGIYSARYMGEDTSYDIKNQATSGPIGRRRRCETYSTLCMCHCSCISGWEYRSGAWYDGRHYRTRDCRRERIWL